MLRQYGVTYLSENRNAELHGVPAVEFTVHQDGYEPHRFTFAKGNHMSKEHMETVMASYLRGRTDYERHNNV